MGLFSAPPRNLRDELLDLDDAPFEEVKDSLSDVRRVNRYLSGYRVLLQHSEPFLKNHSAKRPFTVIDLATGSADQPTELVLLARRLNVPIRVIAIDINRKMLDYAREEATKFPEISFVQCDILNLPFEENSFDLAINSLSLHHFSENNAVFIIQALDKLGELGFIVNDLHRSRVAFCSIFILTRILTKNRLTRYDAPVSVMNAFTPKEMGRLAQDAGVKEFEVHRHFPYRISLIRNSIPK
jgi:SAM-dependent methyltransferase